MCFPHLVKKTTENRTFTEQPRANDSQQRHTHSSNRLETTGKRSSSTLLLKVSCLYEVNGRSNLKRSVFLSEKNLHLRWGWVVLGAHRTTRNLPCTHGLTRPCTSVSQTSLHQAKVSPFFWIQTSEMSPIFSKVLRTFRFLSCSLEFTVQEQNNLVQCGVT